MLALYDLICSFVIGGIVLAMILGFNGTIVEQAGAQTLRSMAQSNLSSVTEIVETEFRRLGYRVNPRQDSSVFYADTNRITFKGDLDNDGVLDLVTYDFNPTGQSGHPNRQTRVMYRRVNGGAFQPINIGITRMRFWYYDSSGSLLSGNPIARPSRIQSIRVAMSLESTAPYTVSTERYVRTNPGVYWERTFKPKNLR